MSTPKRLWGQITNRLSMPSNRHATAAAASPPPAPARSATVSSAATGSSVTPSATTISTINSTKTSRTVSRIVQVVTGIEVTVDERRRQLDALADRCKRIEYELDVWSAIWSTEGMQIAGQAAFGELDKVLKQCEMWQARGPITTFANDDQIAGELSKCNQSLTERMDDYNRSVLHEILLSTTESKVRLLTQDNTLKAIQSMAQSNDATVKRSLQGFIDAGYEELRSSALDNQDRDAIFEGLRTLLTIDNVPTSVQLQGELAIPPFATISNPGSDIFQTQWQGRIVAVKRFRESATNPKRASKFLYEGAIWRMLNHPNVLPFYGIRIEKIEGHPNPSIALVSLWAAQQDVRTFITAVPDCNRRAIVRETAYGIAYLHRRQIVHGAIRGVSLLKTQQSNILIDGNGKPMLTDFGLATASTSDQEALTEGLSSSETSTTIRWLAPELTTTRFPVFASDVFSFARTILEIMTGDKPFKEQKNPWQLAALLNQGQLVPARPQGQAVIDRGLTDGVWALLLQMWVDKPENRPKMDRVVDRLEDLL
ncbi:kinase-like protein [Calocera cornea HHB12733]|uniref:Kinase-like protein n=1 Tax=Calocera cornea HHB12733 TaxID=1353952 RepID=A0A165F0A2_9BASI|nr:kinase-like protein [Calocera cornea HHB12733]